MPQTGSRFALRRPESIDRRWFIKTYAADYWKHIRSAYKERRDQAVEAVRKHLGAIADGCTNPQGEFFLWLEVDPTINTTDLLPTSVERFGVAYALGAPFFAQQPASNTMRVSFSNLSLDRIELGIETLGKALRSR